MRLASIFAVVFIGGGLMGAGAPAMAQECRQCADGVEKTQVNANFQVSLPIDDGAASGDVSKALTSASQSLYDLISRQCDVLANEYKGECRIVQLNVNTSLNDRQIMQFTPPGERPAPPRQHVNANANAVYEISPASVDKAPPKP